MDLTRQYKQDLVILTKTKITGDNVADIIPKFGFRNSISLADEGLSRGILWNEDIDIDLIGKTHQEIHVKSRLVHLPFFT